MTKDEALKLALELIQDYVDDYGPHDKDSGAQYVITAIKEALAQPEQEPVAWWNKTKDTASTDPVHRNNADCQPLYTTPPQRTWVGLTADEMEGLYQLATYMDVTDHIHMLMMAEDKLKEKNDG